MPPAVLAAVYMATSAQKDALDAQESPPLPGPWTLMTVRVPPAVTTSTYQILLGHPLMYGCWHLYKYSVEMSYKAFVPTVKLLGQGLELKPGAVVPLKVKLCRMEKTIVGLLLATGADKARLDSTTRVLIDNYRELLDVL